MCLRASLASAQPSRSHASLAFAWNVAGPWLCVLKARRQQHAARPGTAPRLVDPTVLLRVLSNRRKGAAPNEADRNGADADHNADAVDGEN